MVNEGRRDCVFLALGKNVVLCPILECSAHIKVTLHFAGENGHHMKTGMMNMAAIIFLLEGQYFILLINFFICAHCRLLEEQEAQTCQGTQVEVKGQLAGLSSFLPPYLGLEDQA